MEYIVLGLLILKEMTIYELNSAFGQGLSLIYSASYGNLQYAVKKLLKDEFIEFREVVENGRNKKIYSIKESGFRAFHDWMESEIPLNKLETIMLSKVYFLGLVKDPSIRLEIVSEMIEKAGRVDTGLRQLHDEVAAIQLPENLIDIAKYQFKTLDYGIMAHASGIRWLTDLLDDIRNEMKEQADF